MGYNLWLGEIDELKEYYSRRMGSRSLDGQIMLGDNGDEESLSFVIDGVRKTELTLDEIDSFICGFKDLEDLRRHLNLFDELRDIADKKGRLIIASRFENIDKYQVIYNNPFLQRCAMTIRNKRKNKQPEYLEQTAEMLKYTKKFTEYILDKGARQSLLESKFLPPLVKQNITSYAMSRINNNTLETTESFDRLFKNLMNYKTLRGLVIWESEYLANHSDISKDDIEPELEEVYRQMLEDETRRTTPFKTEMLTEIDSMRDEDGNLDYDRIYSQFDYDDIHANSKRDLQTLGFLPKEESPEEKGPKRR